MRLSLLMLQLFENNFQAVSAYCSFWEHNHQQLDPIAVLRTCGLFATNNTDPIIIRISAKLLDSSPVCVRSQLLPHPYRDRYCDDCCHPLPNLMAITREWPSLVPLPNTTHILLRPGWASKDSHQPVRPHTQFQYGCRATTNIRRNNTIRPWTGIFLAILFLWLTIQTRRPQLLEFPLSPHSLSARK